MIIPKISSQVRHGTIDSRVSFHQSNKNSPPRFIFTTPPKVCYFILPGGIIPIFHLTLAKVFCVLKCFDLTFICVQYKYASRVCPIFCKILTLLGFGWMGGS